MADGKIQVGKVEHYAVYLALVISMITTFLLGMLLTESLFGTGLNYFGAIGEQNKIQKSQARSICYRTADGSDSCDTSGKLRGGSTAPSSPTINGSYQVLMGTITVWFFDNSSNEDGFALERYDSSSRTWQTVGTTGAYTCDPTIYSCDSAPMIHEVWDTVSPITVSPDPYPDGSYTYRVKAYNGRGASYSSTLDIVPFYDAEAPNAPTNLRYVSGVCGISHIITLAWDAPADLPNPGATGVQQSHMFYRSPVTPSYWVNLGYAYPTTGSFGLHIAHPTTTYEFAVTAIDVNGNEGPRSESLIYAVPSCR